VTLFVNDEDTLSLDVRRAAIGLGDKSDVLMHQSDAGLLTPGKCLELFICRDVGLEEVEEHLGFGGTSRPLSDGNHRNTPIPLHTL